MTDKVDTVEETKKLYTLEEAIIGELHGIPVIDPEKELTPEDRIKYLGDITDLDDDDAFDKVEDAVDSDKDDNATRFVFIGSIIEDGELIDDGVAGLPKFTDFEINIINNRIGIPTENIQMTLDNIYSVIGDDKLTKDNISTLVNDTGDESDKYISVNSYIAGRNFLVYLRNAAYKYKDIFIENKDEILKTYKDVIDKTWNKLLDDNGINGDNHSFITAMILKSIKDINTGKVNPDDYTLKDVVDEAKSLIEKISNNIKDINDISESAEERALSSFIPTITYNLHILIGDIVNGLNLIPEEMVQDLNPVAVKGVVEDYVTKYITKGFNLKGSSIELKELVKKATSSKRHKRPNIKLYKVRYEINTLRGVTHWYQKHLLNDQASINTFASNVIIGLRTVDITKIALLNIVSFYREALSLSNGNRASIKIIKSYISGIMVPVSLISVMSWVNADFDMDKYKEACDSNALSPSLGYFKVEESLQDIQDELETYSKNNVDEFIKSYNGIQTESE